MVAKGLISHWQANNWTPASNPVRDFAAATSRAASHDLQFHNTTTNVNTTNADVQDCESNRLLLPQDALLANYKDLRVQMSVRAEPKWVRLLIFGVTFTRENNYSVGVVGDAAGTSSARKSHNT